jgi:ubiquinone/menaquinone biosynthesis C-methylase UbiE
MTTSTREQIKEAYAHDPQGYDRVRLEDPRGRLLSEHDRRIFEQLFPNAEPSWEILEIGAGTGRFTVLVLEKGLSLTATDINEPMLQRLRDRAAEMGRADRCRTEVQDVFNLTLTPDHYDLVYSLHVIPRFLTVQDQVAALESIARVVKPGGVFLFNYRNVRSPYNLMYKGPAISPETIRETLARAGMRITQTRGKWIVNKSLLKRLPLPLGRALVALDRALLRFWPARAWDVFAVAVKDAPTDRPPPKSEP